MLAAGLTFLSPLGAVLALTCLVPLAAGHLAADRSQRAARSLGLAPPPRWRFLVPTLLAALACTALGAAAAQPALRTTRHVSVRSQSEVMYVVDVSRSMAAARTPTGRTRLARARSVVEAIHHAVPDVPSGLAGMTDRVLPYLFSTANGSVFDQTLLRSVRIEAPPPQEVATNATSFESLASLSSGGFFDRTARRRTCVVVTDGETQSYSTSDVAGALSGAGGCRLVVVRAGGTGDRVYGPDSVPESGYAPDPAAGAKTAALAQAAGGRSFDAGDLSAAESAVRHAAEVGPLTHEPARTTTVALAPWLALAALLLTLAFVASRSFYFVMQRLLRRSTYDATVSLPASKS